MVAAGATLVAISPMLEKYAVQMKEKHGIGFPLLIDEDNGVAGDFGVAFTVSEEMKAVYLKLGIDLARYNGEASWRLPMPGRFVIDRSGIVRDAEVHPDYTRRPEPEEILKVLERL